MINRLTLQHKTSSPFIYLMIYGVTSWSGCSSSSVAKAAPEMLCMQQVSKESACTGGRDTWFSLDGGRFCPDMAGAAVAVDPVKVSQCVSSVGKGNPDFWNAFFDCYLDGHTMNCDGDFKKCLFTAESKVSARDIDKTFHRACNEFDTRCPGNDLNPDYCAGSIIYSQSALSQATVCLNGACAGATDCAYGALK